MLASVLTYVYLAERAIDNKINLLAFHNQTFQKLVDLEEGIQACFRHTDLLQALVAIISVLSEMALSASVSVHRRSRFSGSPLHTYSLDSKFYVAADIFEWQ